MTRMPAFLALGAFLAAAGCATFSTVDLVKNSLANAVVTRSITVLPPASEQKVTNFVIWNPLGGSVTSIKRETGGAVPTTRTFTSPNDFKAEGPMFADASVSAGVKYRYTLTVGGKERVNVVEPVASVVEQADLVGPGIDFLSFNVASNSNDAAVLSRAIVADGKPNFSWSDLPNKDASQSYGFFLVVGVINKNSPTGIDARYSAFLDESKHRNGVEFATKSDLQGFSTEILEYLKGVESLAFLAPTTPSGPLPPGDYAWTVLTVNSDARRVAFGIGKISPPTDSKHFRFFRVPATN